MDETVFGPAMSITAAGHQCDSPVGLRIAADDGAVRCWLHMTAAEHELAAELDALAPAYGMAKGRWPYGPNAYLDMRQRVISWADGRRLKLADPRCLCPCWLLSGKCGHCHPIWIDHTSAWHAGRNAGRVLVAQPYGISLEVGHLCSMAADGFDIRVSPPTGSNSQDDASVAELAAGGVTIIPPGLSWYWPQQTWLIEARPFPATPKRLAQLLGKYRAPRSQLKAWRRSVA